MNMHKIIALFVELDSIEYRIEITSLNFHGLKAVEKFMGI